MNYDYENHTAIILGNGPSLNDQNFLQKIIQIQNEKKCVTFGVNKIYLKTEIKINCYLALDRRTWQHWDEIKKLNCDFYFIPERLISRNNDNHHYLGKLPKSKLTKIKLNGANNFANKFEDGFAHGFTSIYPCIQIAYIWGIKEFIICGVDFQRDENGNTHFYGEMRRNKKSWNLAKKSVQIAIEKLKKENIKVEILSTLYGK